MDHSVGIWLVILTIATTFAVVGVVSLSKSITELANSIRTNAGSIIKLLRIVMLLPSMPTTTLKDLEPLREQLEETLKHWEPKK